jgi:hypothetical protein
VYTGHVCCRNRIADCRRAFKNTQLCALNDYSGTLAA